MEISCAANNSRTTHLAPKVGPALAVPLVDLPQCGNGHDEPVATIGVILFLCPCHLLKGVPFNGNQIAGEHIFQGRHASTAQVRLEILERNVVDLNARGGKEPVIGCCRPLGIGNRS